MGYCADGLVKLSVVSCQKEPATLDLFRQPTTDNYFSHTSQRLMLRFYTS
jgi:hypothetical protein